MEKKSAKINVCLLTKMATLEEVKCWLANTFVSCFTKSPNSA